MKKIKAAVTIIFIPVISVFFTGCAALDDVTRIAARQGSHVEDDLARQSAKIKSGVTVVPAKNLNQNIEKCSRQIGKSAVVEAWKLANTSGSQVEESYLFNVARDAIQKCTVSSVGDKVLDELAILAVADFKQQYPQAVVN